MANIAKTGVINASVDRSEDGQPTRLHLSIDLEATPQPSGSGFSKVYASTGGNKAIEITGIGSVSLGLNLFQTIPDNELPADVLAAKVANRDALKARFGKKTVSL